MFTLTMAVPEGAAGRSLSFPTVQTCREGQAAWVQVPAPGQDHDDLERPAPTVAVVPAAESGGQADHHPADAAESGDAGVDTMVTDASPSGTRALAVIGLGAGVAGCSPGARPAVGRPSSDLTCALIRRLG